MYKKIYAMYDVKTGKEYQGEIEELSMIAGANKPSLYNAKSTGNLLKGRYRVREVKIFELNWSREEIERWEEYRKMFKNVEWVKKEGPGVKVLYVRYEN